MEKAKKAAALKAASLVKNGMRIGLGTGTTTHYFIQEIIKLSKEGLKISAVATSLASFKAAQKGGIPLLDIDTLTSLDLTVDGADEIDPNKQMIKGGGGALVREKIIASMSHELLIIVDETKQVRQLGMKAKLPIEIIPFGYSATLYHLEKEGFKGTLRLEEKKPYITDNGNYIVDCPFNALQNDPRKANLRIKEIPGVVDTGFFFDLAGRVIVGFNDGQTLILQ